MGLFPKSFLPKMDEPTMCASLGRRGGQGRNGYLQRDVGRALARRLGCPHVYLSGPLLGTVAPVVGREENQVWFNQIVWVLMLLL